MGYTSRYNGPDLTPEERDVAEALRRYSDRADKGANTSEWTPTALLYRAYRYWRAEHRWRFDPDAPVLLTVRQFGRAVRRLFPSATRCRRSYNGRQQWGYCRLVGPESVESQRVLRGTSPTPPGYDPFPFEPHILSYRR